jgi:hypothetical protein
MKKVPVTRNGIEVGYSIDGKTIQFNDTEEAKKAIEELTSGQMIGVSSRGIGEVVDGKAVCKETTEFAFIERPSQGLIDMMNGGWEELEKQHNKSFSYEPIYKINESIESTKGVWELFKEHCSDVHQLQYWLPDGDRPQIVLNLTPEEFEDLETLFINVKKYRNEE